MRLVLTWARGDQSKRLVAYESVTALGGKVAEGIDASERKPSEKRRVTSRAC
jgi:hypothetical protein